MKVAFRVYQLVILTGIFCTAMAPALATECGFDLKATIAVAERNHLDYEVYTKEGRTAEARATQQSFNHEYDVALAQFRDVTTCADKALGNGI
jgi:hypothetical protein